MPRVNPPIPAPDHASSTAPRITAIVLARDEAHNIVECIDTLRFADEILVVDSGSADATQPLARGAGARVVEHAFVDFAAQRNAALAMTDAEWALMIDADERVPAALAGEIRAATASAGPDVGAFRLRRRNWYLGQPLVFCAAGHDTVVRLLRRGRVTWANKVHEAASVAGRVPTLPTALEHHTARSLGDVLRKVADYSPLSAEELFARGRRTSVAGIVGHAAGRFLKVYVGKRGFLDGARGLLIAGFESAGVFFKYALLWDKQRARKASGRQADPPR
jgi:glycosyltransferase involved in cell wall biosynthesis